MMTMTKPQQEERAGFKAPVGPMLHPILLGLPNPTAGSFWTCWLSTYRAGEGVVCQGGVSRGLPDALLPSAP